MFSICGTRLQRPSRSVDSCCKFYRARNVPMNRSKRPCDILQEMDDRIHGTLAGDSALSVTLRYPPVDYFPHHHLAVRTAACVFFSRLSTRNNSSSPARRMAGASAIFTTANPRAASSLSVSRRRRLDWFWRGDSE